MMQLEIEKNTVQQNEALKLKQALEQIDPSRATEIAQKGSLVITDQQSYYIAISAGQLTVDNKIYFAISPVSPIGLLLKGLTSGQRFTFNGKTYSIKEVR